MDGSRDYHTKWNKLDRERQIPWYYLYMEFKIRYKWVYLWNRNRLTDIREQILVKKTHEVGRHCSVQCSVTQLCPTLCNPVDCSPPGSSVPEISQARIPEWIAISFSRGSSQPRSLVSPVLAGGFFISVPPGKSQIFLLPLLFFFFSFC